MYKSLNPITNPFAPGAGSPPPELVDRGSILNQATQALERVKAGRSEQSLMIVGLRGVSKTVLLNRIADVAAEQGYLAEVLEVPEGRGLAAILVPALRSIILRLDRGERISQAARLAFRALRGFVGSMKLNVGDMSLTM